MTTPNPNQETATPIACVVPVQTTDKAIQCVEGYIEETRQGRALALRESDLLLVLNEAKRARQLERELLSTQEQLKQAQADCAFQRKALQIINDNLACDKRCACCMGSPDIEHYESCQLVAALKPNSGQAILDELAAKDARIKELERENIRRIIHLNRLATWAQQDPTGPWHKKDIQDWVLSQIKAALGSNVDETKWVPEILINDQLYTANAKIAELEKGLKVYENWFQLFPLLTKNAMKGM